jgi:crotonobetaine/carnitine-CoA ligase
MPGTEWKLVDDDRNEIPQGEIGELIHRVPDKKTRGVEYYKNPEASAEKVRGDWVHSGDLFYTDESANLYFVDRKTDSMRRRGENISSWEVENVMEKHPAVAECATFGVPSDLGEDDVMVWVKPAPGVTEIDLKDLMRHCAANMAYFMVPRFVDVVDEIPRTGTLRVQKADMKKRGVSERTWDREREMPELKLTKS